VCSSDLLSLRGHNSRNCDVMTDGIAKCSLKRRPIQRSNNPVILLDNKARQF
jgi:hypothetical protein